MNSSTASSQKIPPLVSVFSRYAAGPVWPANTAVIMDALVPDISQFLMFAQARIRGIDNAQYKPMLVEYLL